MTRSLGAELVGIYIYCQLLIFPNNSGRICPTKLKQLACFVTYTISFDTLFSYICSWIFQLNVNVCLTVTKLTGNKNKTSSGQNFVTQTGEHIMKEIEPVLNFSRNRPKQLKNQMKFWLNQTMEKSISDTGSIFTSKMNSLSLHLYIWQSIPKLNNNTLHFSRIFFIRKYMVKYHIRQINLLPTIVICFLIVIMGITTYRWTKNNLLRNLTENIVALTMRLAKFNFKKAHCSMWIW